MNTATSATRTPIAKHQIWNRERIKHQGVELLADFRPQGHHVFPQKFLENKVAEEKINALANIAVIGPEINIRIRAQNPMDYIDQYKITQEKLKQQFIQDDLGSIEAARYEQWLRHRAEVLAKASNDYIDRLKG